MSSRRRALNREIELKLELADDDFERLRLDLPPGISAGSQSRTILTSVYFDTPDLRLRAERMSLRLRSADGKTWLQTLKTDTGLQSGLSQPVEIEAEVKSREPDLKLLAGKDIRRKVQRLVKSTGLKPVFETVADRTTFVLRKENSTIELALDECLIKANGDTKDLREAELELISGSLQNLYEVARELFSDKKIRPGRFTKAEHGYRLLAQAPDDLQPYHGHGPALCRGEPARDAFAKILQATAEHIIRNHRLVLGSGSVESVHQFRVGLTRFRTAIRILKPYAGPPWIEELESDARILAHAAGHLRDVDVLIEDIYAPIANDVSNVPGFRGLYQALQERRSKLFEEAAESLAQGIWPRFLLNATFAPHLLESGPALDKPVEAIAEEIIDKRWKKVRKYGRRLDSLDLEERHEMRRALKKLRYTCEFFLPIYPGRGALSFVKRLRKMQDVFGTMNDARMAYRLVEISFELASKDPAPLAAAGYIFGRHRAEAPSVWKHAKREWRRLEDAEGYWR